MAARLGDLGSLRRPLCGATNRKGQPCRQRAVDGHWRCKHHGGLSSGPRRRFAVTEAQAAAEAERVADTVARMNAGRLSYIAGEKAAGRKLPWGRPPKDRDPLLWQLSRRDRERAKAERRKREGPYRKFKREAGTIAAERALAEKQRAEQVQAATDHRRALDPTPLPGESYEETPMRYHCALARQRREEVERLQALYGRERAAWMMRQWRF